MRADKQAITTARWETAFAFPTQTLHLADDEKRLLTIHQPEKETAS